MKAIVISLFVLCALIPTELCRAQEASLDSIANLVDKKWRAMSYYNAKIGDLCIALTNNDREIDRENVAVEGLHRIAESAYVYAQVTVELLAIFKRISLPPEEESSKQWIEVRRITKSDIVREIRLLGTETGTLEVNARLFLLYIHNQGIAEVGLQFKQALGELGALLSNFKGDLDN